MIKLGNIMGYILYINLLSFRGDAHSSGEHRMTWITRGHHDSLEQSHQTKIIYPQILFKPPISPKS
jgi:hypothetical protein